MPDARKIFAYIHIKHPSLSPFHDPAADDLERLVRIASRPESKRAVHEVLLEYGLQQHHHRSLRYLVFEPGYTEASLASVRFVYVVPTHRGRMVPTRFEPINQTEEILLQIGRIFL